MLCIFGRRRKEQIRDLVKKRCDILYNSAQIALSNSMETDDIENQIAFEKKHDELMSERSGIIDMFSILEKEGLM